MMVNDKVKFYSPRGTVLSGRISRVWSNALYVSIRTDDGTLYVRSVRRDSRGIHLGDSSSRSA